MKEIDRDFLAKCRDVLDGLGGVQKERDDCIRKILKAKTATAEQIHEVTGLSKARIYQIRKELG